LLVIEVLTTLGELPFSNLPSKTDIAVVEEAKLQGVVAFNVIVPTVCGYTLRQYSKGV
jgi:hypothetical protein